MARQWLKPWQFPGINSPQRICYIDKTSSLEILKETNYEAEKINLPEVSFEGNNNHKLNQSNTLYILNEFENNTYIMEALQNIPNTWIFGPTALTEVPPKRISQCKQKILYCTSMCGLCFHIHCPTDLPLMKRMVKLIKWMGGMFTTEPTLKTSHMITNSTLAKGYTYCMTFDVPIMRPEWVEDCWKRRHEAGFKATSIAENYILQPFAGLGIFIHGYHPQLLSLMQRETVANGGEVISLEDPACTHMVIDPFFEDIGLEDIPLHVQYAVSYDWFWSSLHQSRRAFEDYYQVFHLSSLGETKWALPKTMKLDNLTNEISLISSDEDEELREPVNAISPNKPTEDNEINNILLKREDKRKFLITELWETEKSYIKSLELLFLIQQKATDETQPGGAILNSTEAKIIFGNLSEILKMHNQIESMLKMNVNVWDSVRTAQAFTLFKKEIMKNYITFVTNWTESEKTLKKCKENNPRLCELLKEISEKEKLWNERDLFIRPIQRLPSISLLLKDLKKNTREDSPDMKYLDEAVETICDTLNMMNEDRARIEKQQQIFVIHKIIENCPPDLITSRREFIEEFYAREITSKEQTLGVHLIIFLFSDVLEVAKVRSKYKYQGLLKHQEHELLTNLQQPLKHVAMIPLSAITHVLKFKEDLGCSRKLFGLYIRNEDKCQIVNCFEYLDQKLGIEDMLHLMAKFLKRNQTVSSKREEEFILTLPCRRISVDPVYHNKSPNKSAKDVRNVVVKAVTFMLKRTESKQRKPTIRRSFSCGDLNGSSLTL